MLWNTHAKNINLFPHFVSLMVWQVSAHQASTAIIESFSNTGFRYSVISNVLLQCFDFSFNAGNFFTYAWIKKIHDINKDHLLFLYTSYYVIHVHTFYWIVRRYLLSVNVTVCIILDGVPIIVNYRTYDFELIQRKHIYQVNLLCKFLSFIN